MMNFKPTRKCFLILAMICSLVAGLCSADTISYTTTTPIASSLTDWANTLSFQQFDSSLGTLNSVKIDLNASLSTIISIVNISPTGSSSGNGQTKVSLTVDDAGNNLNNPVIEMLSSVFSYSVGPGGTATSGILIQNGTSSDTYTTTTLVVLTEFTGPGSILLNASTLTSTILTNTGGNTYAAQVTYADLGGAVTYDYDPIPEPATIAMLGLGSIALVRRKLATRKR